MIWLTSAALAVFAVVCLAAIWAEHHSYRPQDQHWIKAGSAEWDSLTEQQQSQLIAHALHLAYPDHRFPAPHTLIRRTIDAHA